ncbi:MAG: flavodoxin family protein [Clostridiales bacterium]|nr:flavodoxin family protein [Clostridiales bacterium]
MKITVINGGMRHGSTWHCKEAILKAIGEHTETEVTEFSLPRDLPHFCVGCYQCFLKGEQSCPHAAFVQPIAQALCQSDLIMLASPVYGLDVSGQMKACLDHLCYQWMSHRPSAAMFRKLGLVVTTTAGMGLRRTGKTMRLSLKYWGVQKIFTFAKPVAAMRWEEIPDRKRKQIEQSAQVTASGILRAAGRGARLRKPFFRSLLFAMMAGMQKKNDWNPTDREHWEKQGWLSGARPY